MTRTVDSVDHLQHFVRAWPGQVATKRTESTRTIPDRFLVFDTETTTDETQRLTFGTFFVGFYVDGCAVPCGEGIIYADDLPESDPDGYRLLQEHVKANPLARVEIGHVGTIAVDPLVRLVSRTEFIYRYFYPLGMETSKRRDAKPAAVVGFNLPFDLSRIANNVGPAKGGSAGGFRNGFSFEMMPGRPNVRTNSMGSKGMVYQFQGRLEKNPAYRAIPLSTFVDVSVLVFALTGRPMSLARACERFRVPFGKDKVERHGIITPEYIWYARNDARATMGLYETTSNELYRHSIPLSANKAYSPASIAKAYLEEMGVLRPLVGNKDFPQEMHGYATAGFYGGRSEVIARRVPVPVALYDFTSMYPTVNALLGMWELLKADHIEPREETGAVQALLGGIALDACFDPATWRNVVGFAKVKLDGDVVPIRATYGESPTPTIGLNHAYSDDPMWYSIPELIASILITGKAPQIEMAYRLYPVGENTSLTTIDIRGVRFDPHGADFFVYLIEKRQELRTEHKKVCEQFRTSSDSSCDCEESNLIEFLKVLANSGCYGVFVEMNRQEHDDAQDTSFYGISGESWEMPIERPEKAGQYCFPAIGVVITSAARLMLAMLERCVTDAGGVWAFCDTDSMCIVSSASGATVYDRDGRPIPVLTYEAVEAIRMRFDCLSPYDRSKVPTLLKCETQDYIDAGVELYGHCISAKRYALYKREGDTVTVVKRTEHGLGAYLNPHDPDIRDEKGQRAWVDEIWEYLILSELCDAGLLDVRPDPPDWSRRFTMMSRTVTTWGVYHSLAPWNDGKPYRDRIKPFSFHLITSGTPLTRPGEKPVKCLLIAPYARDASRWEELEWRNIYEPNGDPYDLTGWVGKFNREDDLVDGPPPRVASVGSYFLMMMEYKAHPESKYRGPDGGLCNRKTRGMLQRRHVVLTTPDYIGKESNRLEARKFGTAGIVGATINYYGNDTDHFAVLVPPVLARFSYKAITASVPRVKSHHSVSKALSGSGKVRDSVRAGLTDYAVEVAMADMGKEMPFRPKDRVRLYSRWRDVLREWASLRDIDAVQL